MNAKRSTLHNKILNTCSNHSISQENPVFFDRLVFYLRLLRECDGDFIEHNAIDVDFALVETHTMIEMDDDLDNAGCEYLMDLWEKALDIEYGRDYGYVQGPRGEAVLCGMGVSPL